MEKQGPRTTRQAMGLMDFGQYELKMLQEVQTHSEVSKNSLVFFFVLFLVWKQGIRESQSISH